MLVLRWVGKTKLRDLVIFCLPLYFLVRVITFRFCVIEIFSLSFLAPRNYLERGIFCVRLMFVKKNNLCLFRVWILFIYLFVFVKHLCVE